jgi:YVTN family beta-propeller protein
MFAQQIKLPLRTEADVPLTGNASRFDYQSFDAQNGRLYIAHLGDSMLTVVDTKMNKVVGDVRDLKHVHGVLAVPELHRIYASATGTDELAVIDDKTLQVIARVPTGKYPDGIAYAGKQRKLYVSNKQGRSDTVIDAETNRVVATVQLNGPAGNTQYDAVSNRIFVAVSGINQIAEIDPASDKVTANYPLPGCSGAHGLLIDRERRLAFAACENNARLAVFDLAAKKMTAVYPVGNDPDVLAFDTGLRRLYVSSESGFLTLFDEKDGGLETVGNAFFAANAHTVAVDSGDHRVFLPLENVNGKPVLRIVLPSQTGSQ